MSLDEKIAGMSPRKQAVMRLSHEYGMPNRVETWLDAGIPMVIDRREGYRLWDMDGRELQDFHINGGTYNLGHRHPECVTQLLQGLQTLDVGNHHFPSEVRGKLSKMLAEHTPGDLHYTLFTPSGSEANDMAIKTARKVTGRKKIVAFDIAYHGSSGFSGAVGESTNAEYFGSAFKDDFLTVPYNDTDALEAVLKREDVALFMVETLPATFGFPLPDTDYYSQVRALCDRYGTLLSMDEVQTGMMRSGKLWAFENYGIVPDMMVTGKGLGAGLYPIGALVMTRTVGAWLEEHGWGYVSTFGGSELGCHVGLKALEITAAPSTRDNVADLAIFMRAGLDGLRDRYPFFCDIRQLGVIFALGFDHEIGGMKMATALFEQGLWAMFASFDRSYLQFKLGILADRAFCDEALGKLEAALQKVSA
ncbi:MAG: aspartate aminotransferase family protein [Sphingopyxis sp.]|nr:MAG: aspartate aminotransferase family protein [Sphingopyxis sp.]